MAHQPDELKFLAKLAKDGLVKVRESLRRGTYTARFEEIARQWVEEEGKRIGSNRDDKVVSIRRLGLWFAGIMVVIALAGLIMRECSGSTKTKETSHVPAQQ